MAEEEIGFVDAEQYLGKGDEKISFRCIVLEHLKRIGNISSQEFHGGYWQEKTKYIGTTAVTDTFYVQDSREEYTNSVDYLFDILFPHFDEKIKKDIAEYEKFEKEKIDELYKKHTKTDKNIRSYSSEADREAFLTDKVKLIKRKLFRHLNSFLFRQRYMESKTIREES